jgi:hypothetical protein
MNRNMKATEGCKLGKRKASQSSKQAQVAVPSGKGGACVALLLKKLCPGRKGGK